MRPRTLPFAAGLLLALAIAPTSLSFFLGTARAEPGGERPLDRQVGERVQPFVLDDATSQKRVALLDFVGKKALVVVFAGTQCPISNVYLPKLNDLNDRYGQNGVAFLLINSNESETAEQVAEHAREFGLKFPVLKDPVGRVARQFEAERTPEALVIDGRGWIRYRGAIDDQYGYGVRKEKPGRHYIAEAIDAILEGKDVETKATSVEGCPIELGDVRPLNRVRVRPRPSDVIEAIEKLDPPIDPDSLGPVNFAEHVAPILQERCETCHRPNQAAPFALQTFEDAKRRGLSFPEVLDDYRMPPWHADPRYGHFVNDRSMTARERATLIAWVDQGMPEGEPSKMPPAKTWPEGWSIGEPDVIFEMPEPYTVKAEGVLPYQRFRVPTNFEEDRWVQAIELMPGARLVVHHILLYLRDPSQKGGPGNLEQLAAYAPGDLTSRFPEGTAKRIPAGSELIFELHYTPIGKTLVDLSRAGFVFAKEPPKYQVKTFPILNHQFTIPAGADNHEVRAGLTLPQDTILLGFLPHMHLRGKDFRYLATEPGGEPETLLSVPLYDFSWQSYYWLSEPKTLPKGTKIDCVAHFDNSKNNPYLTEEDTRQSVRWGEQTWDEMMIGFLDVLIPVETESAKAAKVD